MKKMLITGAIFLSAFCQPAMSQQTEKSGEVTGWNTLNRPDYSIQYPPEWELNESGMMGTLFYLFTPLESPSDNFRENINLVIEDISGKKLTVEQYGEAALKLLASYFNDFSLKEKECVKDGKRKYFRTVWSCVQGEYHITSTQYCFLTRDKVYILTLGCKNDTYLQYKDIGEKIIRTFTLK